MKKILVACDSFKGSFSSKKIGQYLTNELENAQFVTLADGGEGSLQAISNAKSFKKIELIVKDVNFKAKETHYLFDESNRAAYIETALIVGMKDEAMQNTPINERTTYGVGEMILDAVNNGALTINIFLGGTSTNDCGIGMLEALGWEFYSYSKKLKNLTPKHFSQITRIIPSRKQLKAQINICSDVKNPLFGENGASKIYGPQKGLTNVAYADHHFQNIAKMIKNSKPEQEGAGAAGGLGFALQLNKNVTTTSGANFISELLKLENKIIDCDVVITGEGSFNEQTFNGKLVSQIINLASKHKKPVIVICGINKTNQSQFNQNYIIELKNDNETINEAITNSWKNLESKMPMLKNLIKTI